jgi:hypothetical protein
MRFENKRAPKRRPKKDPKKKKTHFVSWKACFSSCYFVHYLHFKMKHIWGGFAQKVRRN